MQQIVIYSLASFFISFLLGSIPWGLIISKLFYKTDIREHGSGNIGTTNAYRTMGMVGGTAVFALDFLKGLAAAIVAAAFAVITAYDVSAAAGASLAGGDAPMVLFGLELADAELLEAFNNHVFGFVQGLGVCGCVCGHIFSPWLRFKGGKGVAVAAGALLIAYGWQGVIVLAALFGVLTLVTRYASVGSLAAAVGAPFVAWWASSGEPVFVALITLAAGVVVWAHRGNISRLLSGNERRIGVKSEQE